MDIRAELHKLVDELDDDAAKQELHADIDNLDDEFLPAALTYMRALHGVFDPP